MTFMPVWRARRSSTSASGEAVARTSTRSPERRTSVSARPSAAARRATATRLERARTRGVYLSDVVEREGQDQVDGQELHPLEPVGLAVVDEQGHGGDGEEHGHHLQDRE